MQIAPPKSFGFGIGIFAYEGELAINENNDRVIAAGNCFLVSCTFTELNYESKKHGTKNFAVQLVDTVLVV